MRFDALNLPDQLVSVSKDDKDNGSASGAGKPQQGRWRQISRRGISNAIWAHNLLSAKETKFDMMATLRAQPRLFGIQYCLYVCVRRLAFERDERSKEASLVTERAVPTVSRIRVRNSVMVVVGIFTLARNETALTCTVRLVRGQGLNRTAILCKSKWQS